MALLLLPGGVNVAISVRKRKLPVMFCVLATCWWEGVGRWLLFLPWRVGVAFLSAKCLSKPNCHKYFHTWLLTSAPAQVVMSHQFSVAFEDFLQKLHFSRNIHFCSFAEEIKTVPHKPGHWEMTMAPGPDHTLCPLCT